MFCFSNVEHRYDGQLALSVRSWEAKAGEHWLLSGVSGSGKSTALHLLAGLLRPSSGRIVVAEQDLDRLRGAKLDRWRGRSVGFVPQRLHLVASLSVLDNVLLAQYLAGASASVSRAKEVLAKLRIVDLSQRKIDTLSYGQAQRAAVARAVVNRPQVLIADEPTASLDDVHAEQTLALLTGQALNVGATLVVASHDARIRSAFEHRFELNGVEVDSPS